MTEQAKLTDKENGSANGQPHSLLISDLHLCHSRPAITELFIKFMQTQAVAADSLFILGDLFEYWAGDDDAGDTHHRQVVHAVKALSAVTEIFFIHGNRDFLIGDAFALASGVHLLDDPSLLTMYGQQVLLSHGDHLCTDDVAYQQFRLQVRNRQWQQTFLSQPLAARKQHIENLRLRSEQEKTYKSASIMDVNPQAVDAMLRQYHYPQVLIHGHTHRPALHQLQVDGRPCERWVLGDWYEQGSCLKMDAHGIQMQPILG